MVLSGINFPAFSHRRNVVLLTPNSSPASLIVISLSIVDILDYVWILVKCSVNTPV
jgi:hypothetical protein